MNLLSILDRIDHILSDDKKLKLVKFKIGRLLNELIYKINTESEKENS